MKINPLMSACAIVAIAGSALHAQSIDWVSPVDGDWNVAGNWAGGNIPDNAGEIAVLGLSGMYTVTSNSSRSIGGLMLINQDASLRLGNVTYSLSGDMLNNGLVSLNYDASIFNALVNFQNDATISGSGVIRLTANSSTDDAQINATSGTLTHASGHTIAGSGRLSGVMSNTGDIIADDPAGVGLELNGTMTQNAGGRVGAENGGKLLLGSSGTTIGGELFTTTGGEIVASASNHQLDGVNLTGDLIIPGESRTLIALSSLSNNGSISINPELSIFNGILRFDNSATINGSGTLSLFTTGDYGDAQLRASAGVDLTIGAGQLVQGSGLLEALTTGAIINQGTINANDPAQALGLQGVHIGDGGIYRADGGELNLRPNAMISNAVFDSSGDGRIEHDTGGVATISDSTNLGDMIVRGSSGTLNIEGSFVNHGVVELNPDFMIFNANVRTDTGVTIGGSGSIVMTSAGSNPDARLYARDASTLTIGSNQTVMGGGLIDTDAGTGGTVLNLGTINANQAATGKAPARPLELNGNHDGMGVGVYRADDGVLQLGNGLTISGANFDSSGAGIVAMTTGGASAIDGATNTGELAVYGQGGILSLTDDLINDGTLTINGDMAIFNATVQFAASDVMIGGSGTVRMVTAGNINDAQLNAIDGVTGTIWFDQTVAGSGVIQGQGTMGVVTNVGLILADDPTMPLELRGSQNGVIGAGAGTYRATTDSVLSFGGGMYLNGGILETESNGEIAATAGNSTLAYVENNGLLGVWGDGATLNLVGLLINNGTVHINSNSSIFNAKLLLTTNLEVFGTGEIIMTTAGNENDAQLETAVGLVGTLGTGQTLRGDGQINGEFNILGSIEIDGPSRKLSVDTINLDTISVIGFDLSGDAEPNFDRMLVRGGQSLNLNGATASISIEPGYVPDFGQTWNIISGSTTGTFSEVTTTNAPFGQVYRVIYESSRVYVILTCDADLSGDGGIDFFDVSTFLNFFGSQDVRGDLNGDGNFDFFDVSTFLQLFSQGCNP